MLFCVLALKQKINIDALKTIISSLFSNTNDSKYNTSLLKRFTIEFFDKCSKGWVFTIIVD